MNHLDPNKTGLALGALMGGFHFLWSLLIAVGWAQPLLDFIFMLHMIKPVYVVDSFSVGRASALVVMTLCVGYVVGQIFARVWNALQP